MSTRDEFMRNKLQDLNQQAFSIEDTARKLARGIWVEVTSDFNGQPYGRSKPSLRGKQFQIKNVHIDRHGLTLWIGTPEDPIGELACRISDIRFMETQPK